MEYVMYVLHYDTSSSIGILVYSYVCQRHCRALRHIANFPGTNAGTQAREHSQLALCIDALIAGRRFLPYHINHKPTLHTHTREASNTNVQMQFI